MVSPLHPDCVAFLKLVEELGRPRFEDIDWPEARTMYAGGRKVLQPPSPEVAEARDLALPNGVPVRL